MNPHFIFNRLNGIYHCILASEIEKASEYLSNFARLLRMVLMHSEKNFISLREEVDLLRHYLKIEALRTTKPFDFDIQVEDGIDPDVFFVPGMLIQPFLENAIWHGLVHRKEKGQLDISVTLSGRVLEVIVTDNGIGRKMAMEIKEKKNRTHHSMGMKVTEGRIALIRKINNTKDANVEVLDLQDNGGRATGTQVKIVLPAEFLF